MSLLETETLCDRVRRVDTFASVVTVQVLIMLSRPTTIAEIRGQLGISYNTTIRIIKRWRKYMTSASLKKVRPKTYRYGRRVELNAKGKEYLFCDL